MPTAKASVALPAVHNNPPSGNEAKNRFIPSETMPDRIIKHIATFSIIL
jgi:hypothetical protein